MAYQLEGRLLELCTCGDYCPCQATGQPDSSDCDAVNVWHIDKGSIDGTDVSNLTLVSLGKVHGHVLQGKTVVFYVDEKATPNQQEALLNVWTGKLSGPVADLALLIGKVAAVERAPIDFKVRAGKGTLKVGQAISANVVPSPSHGATGHSATHQSDVCTTLPGSQTSVGDAKTYRIDSSRYGFDIDIPNDKNYKVIHGQFRFEG